jgi:hypothetical protein
MREQFNSLTKLFRQQVASQISSAYTDLKAGIENWWKRIGQILREQV